MKSYLISIIVRIIIAILVLNISSCKVAVHNELPDNTRGAGKPSVVFLNCTISYDAIAQEYEMDLVEQTVSEGSVKKAMVNSKAEEQSDLTYHLLNKNKQRIASSYIEDPLNTTIEYVDESGHIAKKDIKMEKALFSVRVQLTPDSEFISFEKDGKQLLMVDINFK